MSLPTNTSGIPTAPVPSNVAAHPSANGHDGAASHPRPGSDAAVGPAGRPADGAAAPQGEGSGVPTGQGMDTGKCCHERLPASAGLVRPLRPAAAGSAARPERPNARGRGAGRKGLSELLDALSPRDLAVLDLVADHRFLSTAQLERFVFHGHASAASSSRTTRRVMTRLERDRLVERPFRRIGGMSAGSASSVWMLTSMGQRLRGLRSGVGAVGRVRPPGDRFTAHYLAIAETHLALVEAERAGQLMVAKVEMEPRCWRPFTGLGGSRDILKPDLMAVTATSRDAEYEDHWFVEVDRGTESLPTLIRQCQAYETYRRTGTGQAESGVFPLIVWVVPDTTRADKLTAAITATRGLDPQLYRVATPEGFIPLVRGGDDQGQDHAAEQRDGGRS